MAAEWKHDQLITIRMPAMHAQSGGYAVDPAMINRQKIGHIHRDFAVVHDEIVGAHYLYHLPTGYQLGIGLIREIDARTAVLCLYSLPVKWDTHMPLEGAESDVLEEIRELVGIQRHEGCLNLGAGGLAIFGGPEVERKLPSDYILEEIAKEERERRNPQRKRLKSLR